MKVVSRHHNDISTHLEDSGSFYGTKTRQPFFQPVSFPASKIDRSGDKYEQEANRMADAVMRMPDSMMQMQSLADEQELLQMKAERGKRIQMKLQTPDLQMKCKECEDKEKPHTEPPDSVIIQKQDGSSEIDTGTSEEIEATPEEQPPEEDIPNITIELPSPLTIRVNGVMYTSPTFLVEGPNGQIVDIAPYTGSGVIDFPLAALESLGIPVLSYYQFHFGRARQYLGQHFENAYALSGGTSFIRNALHYGYITADDVTLFGAPSSYSLEHYGGIPHLNIVANPMDIGTMINVSYFNYPLREGDNNPAVMFSITAPFDQNPFEAFINLGGAISHALGGDLYNLPGVTHNYPRFQNEPNEAIGTPTSTTQISPKAESDIDAPPWVKPQLNEMRGAGQSLPNATQNFMESRIGADFKQVKIHTNSQAVQLNKDLGAQAFTAGNDIFFNRGKWNPHSDSGKHLLAHELVHVVQQGHTQFRVQKEEMPDQEMEAPDTVEEKREFVNGLIQFLQISRQVWESATINQSTFNRVLEGWKTGVSTAEGYINTDLNQDTGLTRQLRQAYVSVLRLFMARAATQLNKQAVELYLQNMHLIPEWAWPQSSDFNLQNNTEKRRFIQTTIDTLNEVTTFSGYQALDDAALTDILSRLKNLMNEQVRIIVADFGDNATLRDDLHAAYLSALRSLLTRAAPAMNKTVTELAVKYMHLIPEGLENEVSGISTPVPLGTTADTSGNIVFGVSGFEVKILPDGTKQGTGAETTINLDAGRINFTPRNGSIISFNGPRDEPEAVIQTKYAPNASASGDSAYGHGTTAEDRAAGNTSLGFHEGRHGLDYILYLRNNPPPSFDGTVGMSVSDFKDKLNEWQQEWTDYQNDIAAASVEDTDCVGNTIDDFRNGQGQVSHECP